MRLNVFSCFLFSPVVLASMALAADATAQAQQAGPVMWETPLGRVVYAREDGPAAIFTYEVRLTGGHGMMAIAGLAGEFGGPGPLDGYWSEPDMAHDDAGDEMTACPFAIVDADGRTTRNWGRLTIMFPQDDFPGDWLMLKGRCLSEPANVLSAKLIQPRSSQSR